MLEIPEYIVVRSYKTCRSWNPLSVNTCGIYGRSASHLLLPTITGGWTDCQTNTSDWPRTTSVTNSSSILLLANTIHARSQKVQFRGGDQTGRVHFRVRFILSAATKPHSKEAKSNHFFERFSLTCFCSKWKKEEAN